MLVLSRHLGETIVIDRNIKVTIVKDRDGKYDVGIEAPKHIEIHRLEVLKRIKNYKE